MDLKEVDILGDAIGEHWYYRSKAKAVQHLLGQGPIGTILDVGAGSGFFSRHLLAHGGAVEAWCVDTSYAQDSDAEESGKPLHFRRALERVDAQLVLLMDVLEHVDDDVGLLRNCIDQVPRGCRFLITVPAFKFLWSGHDVFLEHRRRYTLPALESVVATAGLQVKCGTYYFGAIFPLAATVRLLKGNRGPARSELVRHHRVTNSLLAAVCEAERHVMRLNRLAGLSVFCVAEKC
ncbi:MAG TPA: methyltransferase domain-containing protein [Pseudomonadales bacterium]